MSLLRLMYIQPHFAELNGQTLEETKWAVWAFGERHVTYDVNV